MIACLKGKKPWDLEMETTFMRNGSKLLEELVAFCNGKCNPIRSFSTQELKRATKNYDNQLVVKRDRWYKLYKGMIQDRPVTVKKFRRHARRYVDVVGEIVFTSVLSAQKNVLKLLGCCLETTLPILVFEYAKNGTLRDHIFVSEGERSQPLPWKCRLKIAVDLSNVIAYLHNAFPKPIIHRSIRPSNILLDEDNVAKLSDFSVSVSIPDGEFQVEDIKVIGTQGYIAPEYIRTCCFNEKIDVYSFGVILLMLLTGQKVLDSSRSEIDEETDLKNLVRKRIDEGRFNEVVDPVILNEGSWPGKDQQLNDFALIALQCIRLVEDRPAIIEVSKQLRDIYRTLISHK